MDKKQQTRVRRLIKRGKEILSDQDRLVKDWNNLLEFADGTVQRWESGEISRNQANHCRACVLGGVWVAYAGSKFYDEEDRSEAATMLSRAIRKQKKNEVTDKRTIREVQAVYNMALADLEKVELD